MKRRIPIKGKTVDAIKVDPDTFARMQSSNLRVIEWKPFPENKPTRVNEDYLITCNLRGKHGFHNVVIQAFWDETLEWGYDYDRDKQSFGDRITAFAELPEPYKP